ncbi:hypothetical protein JL721_5594 [Aureococcus anophagefferens]|nr:hypothetical protein JL721_5594 [Aureococcus anophagefferens]
MPPTSLSRPSRSRWASSATRPKFAELARVHEELRKWTDIYTWMETDAANTYFELQCAPPPCMDGIALAASKTYARGLVFITVYFEKAFYVVVQDGEGDQPLLDVKFPDVSQPGQGIHVANYAGDRTWLKLALWHSLAAENAPTRSSPTPAQSPKTMNLATDSYIQMYTVLKATEERGAGAGTTRTTTSSSASGPGATAAPSS